MTVATRARVGGFSPAALAGLQMWLDASRITGLADANPVVTWADVSGQGRDVTQANATNRPIMKRGVVNGRDAVRFVADDYLQSAAFALAQPTTVVLVGIVTGFIVTNFFFDGQGAGRQAVFTDGSSWSMYAGSVVSGGSFDGNWHVFTATFNGASSTLRVDGTQVLAASAGTLALAGVTIGSAGDAPGAFLYGDLAEVAVYDNVLAVPRQLERHLGLKYGITVA